MSDQFSASPSNDVWRLFFVLQSICGSLSYHQSQGLPASSVSANALSWTFFKVCAFHCTPGGGSLSNDLCTWCFLLTSLIYLLFPLPRSRCTNLLFKSLFSLIPPTVSVSCVYLLPWGGRYIPLLFLRPSSLE